MNKKNVYFYVLSLLLLLPSHSLVAATLTATLDRYTIGESDTVNLIIRFDEQTIVGSPDFNVFKDTFDRVCS